MTHLSFSDLMSTTMTATTAHSATYDGPQTQNTAPVIEFRCLWTSDIRRKQKRWQDGRLKFHTFNKRVMVYDERSNFIGDTHWREDHAFGEGEEVELERGGTLVEVGECIGKDDQDLTELIDKRVKEREERVAAKNAASPATARLPGNATPVASAIGCPKPLNALLGTPSGHYGRAMISNVSPFDQRQKVEHIRGREPEERPAKRRKRMESPPSKNGYAQSLTGVPLILSSSRPSSTIRPEPLRLKSANQQIQAQRIDLTRDDHDFTGVDDNGVKTKARSEKPSADIRMLERKQERFEKGYANSLTGTSLTLSTPRPTEIRTLGRSNASSTEKVGRIEPRTLDEDESAQPKIPRKVKKQRSAVDVKRARVEQPRQAETPSSERLPPPTLEGRVPDKKRTSVWDDGPADTSKCLRIKPRAPPKMMMLMQRSRSSATSRSELSDKTSPAAKAPQSKPRSDVPDPSQATMQLQAFRQKQEALLKDRLEGQRPKVHQDMLSSPEGTQTDDEDAGIKAPSLLVDIGIDHTVIDAVLSKRQCVKKPTKAPRNACEVEGQPAVKTSVNGNGAGTRLDKNTTTSDGGDKPLGSPFLGQIAKGSSPTDASNPRGKLIGPTPPNHTQVNEAIATTPSILAKGSGDEAGSPKIHPARPLSQRGHTADSRLTHDVQAQLAPSVLSDNGASDRTQGTGGGSEAVFAVTNRFSKILFPEGMPKGVNATDGDRQMPIATNPPEIRPASSDRARKNVLESANRSPTNKTGLGKHPRRKAAASAMEILPLKTKPNGTRPEAGISTSGLHLQIGPAAPHAPAMARQDEESRPAERDSGSGWGRGPWSREAFDLFGSWRPLGRSTPAGVPGRGD